jgi:hypothetical protein
MSLPLVFHTEAREEIDAAYAWYEQQRTGLGEEYLVAVRRALDGIEENPAIHGLIYRDIRAALLRRFPYVV